MGASTIRAIYLRIKNSEGRWRYSRVTEGRGVKTGTLTGPFYVRYAAGLSKAGKPVHHWQTLAAETFPDAKIEAGQFQTAQEAKSKGLSVGQLNALKNSNRIPLRSAIETYMQTKSNREKKTVQQYRLTLDQFAAITKVGFLDEINEGVLRSYKQEMEKSYSGKTIDTRMGIVKFLLKKNGIAARLPRDEMPSIEEEAAVPYTDHELSKLFAAMNAEEKIRYLFFLGTGCRDKEVTYASWTDVDWTKSQFHVRQKADVGFKPKQHESRTIQISADLLDLLKLRHRKPKDPRWIFVNDDGKPDNHFLRKLKRIAKRAGLNCGNCTTEITEGRWGHRKKRTVSCKTHPICQHFYLHRFRKTAATKWSELGVPVRTLQVWLGHKQLETTMGYLGIADSMKMQPKVDNAFNFKELSKL